MKRAIAILFSVLLAGCVSVGCQVKEEGFAANPEAEYRRVASLSGDNVIFNFDSLTSLQVEHKASYLSPRIVSDDGDGIANIDAIYQYSRSNDGVKTYAAYRHIWDFSTDDSGIYTPQYGNSSPQGYQNGSYYWGAGLAPDSRTYEEILLLAETHGRQSPETIYRRILTLPNADILENFEGGKSGGTFIVKAVVKDGYMTAFAAWMRDFYYYLQIYGEDISDFHFFDFADEYVDTAVITVRSTKQSLTDVVVELNTFGRRGMGEMKFEARTAFQTGRVQVRDITTEG